MTDKELQSIHDAVIDDSTGTPVLRSDLYQKKYTQINTNETARAANAISEVNAQAQTAWDQVSKNYDGTQPYSSSTPKTDAQVTEGNPAPPVTAPKPPVVSPAPTQPSTSTSNYQAQIDAMMAQAQQIQQGINSYKAGNTQPTTTSYTAPTTYKAPVSTPPPVPTPTPTTPTTTSTTSSGYTFKPSGTNVEVWQNGTRISTGSKDYVKTAYGYTG
jgi:hypothetical protein